MKIHSAIIVAGLLAATPVLAQTGTTSGPAAGGNAAPTSATNKNMDKSKDGQMAPSGAAASVGAPGTAGKAGAESDPGTVPAPGSKK